MQLYKLPIIACLVVIFGSGCTALNTFPKSARSGDTVALALGSPIDLTRANTTVEFVPDSGGNPVDLTPNVRSIFKLYADKLSEVYEIGSNTGLLIDYAGHEPWITIAVIDLPTNLNIDPNNSLYGTVQFTTPAIYPSVDPGINSTPIPLEILPGMGSPSDFPYQVGDLNQPYGDLTTLEPQPHAAFSPTHPNTLCPCPDYAAIEIKVSMPTNAGIAMTPELMRLVAEDMTLRSESARSVSWGLKGGQELTVMFISPIGKLKYYETRFAITLLPGILFSGAPAVTSIRYFDINGVEVFSGPTIDYQVALK
jgi:hypothetical protein